jgi:hypothetical protein
MRGIAHDLRNAFSKRGIAFRRKGRILRDNAPMAVISGLQRGFAARGFGAGFLRSTARFGVLGDGFGTRCFCLFQSLTRRSESCFSFGNMLHGSLFFCVGHRARLCGVTIRTQRRMGFARAPQPYFSRGQFAFRGLQLRRTCGSGFCCLIGSAFRIAHSFTCLSKRCGGCVTPRGQGGFAFNQA